MKMPTRARDAVLRSEQLAGGDAMRKTQTGFLIGHRMDYASSVGWSCVMCLMRLERAHTLTSALRACLDEFDEFDGDRSSKHQRKKNTHTHEHTTKRNNRDV